MLLLPFWVVFLCAAGEIKRKGASVWLGNEAKQQPRGRALAKAEQALNAGERQGGSFQQASPRRSASTESLAGQETDREAPPGEGDAALPLSRFPRLLLSLRSRRTLPPASPASHLRLPPISERDAELTPSPPPQQERLGAERGGKGEPFGACVEATLGITPPPPFPGAQRAAF